MEPEEHSAGDRFDVEQLEAPPPLKLRLLLAAAHYPILQYLMDFLRWWRPVVRLLGLAWVLRQEQVRQVLGDSKRFPVPWGWKMELVTSDRDSGHDGRNFVLGMNGYHDAYKNDYRLLAHAFAYEDVGAKVTQLAALATEQALAQSRPKAGPENGDAAAFDLDLVQALVIGIPSRLCATYYGLPIDDPVYIGKCSLAVSSFVFSRDFDPDPQGEAGRAQRMALDAAVPLRRVIRHGIRSARDEIDSGQADASTPLARLVAAAQSQEFGAVDDDRIHVQLFGMILGFVPTNVLAAGNILETLLREPEFLRQTVEAARFGDDDRLWRCLRETLRFRNINFGPLRRCAEDTVLGDGPRGTRIRKGEKILAATQSAMFDRDCVSHPHQFDSKRPDEDYLVFGVGQHWCVGAYIAIAQITQMFKVLLTQYDLQAVPGKAGAMRRFGLFPLHMQVRLTPVAKP